MIETSEDFRIVIYSISMCRMFVEYYRGMGASQSQIEHLIDTKFAKWLEDYVCILHPQHDMYLRRFDNILLIYAYFFLMSC
jgi:hypothetical protein